MRLTELEPRLVISIGDDADPERYALIGTQMISDADGILLLCPCGGGHELLLWFAGRPRVPAKARPVPRWQADGATIGTLTLSPSVNAHCWHGWIRSGNAEAA
jgi:hypothetical protein